MPVRNEHLVVIMLEPMPKGQEFEIWPPHITIVPWFPCDDARRLDANLSAVAKRHQPFEVKTGKTEDWGRTDKFNVVIINDEGFLHLLHEDVFNSLETDGFPIHQKDFLGAKYTPHITLRNRLAKGAEFKDEQLLRIDRFSLIKQDRLKGSGQMIKSVVKDYELGR